MNVNSWGNTGVGTEIGYQRSGLSARKEQDKWFRLESVAHLLMVWTKKTKFELQLFLVTSHPCSKEIFEFRHAARKKTLGVRELSSPTNNCLYASTTISIIAVQNSDERATASFSLPWLRSCWSYAVHSECLSAFNKDASEIVNWAVSALIRPACLQLYPEKFNSRRKRVSYWAHFFQH